MMDYLQPIQFLLRILAVALLYCIGHVIYFRVEASKFRNFPDWVGYLLKKHRQYVIACVVIVVLIIAIIEGVVAPHLGRHHYSPLLDFHLVFCTVMVVSTLLSKRPIFARLAEISTVVVSVTGFILTFYLV